MKTKSIVSFLLFTVTLSFVSCSKEDTADNLTGYTYVGIWQPFSWMNIQYRMIEFTSDMEFYECYCTEDGSLLNQSNPAHWKHYGTYKLEGNNITFLTHDTESTEFERGELKNNKTRLDVYLQGTNTRITFHMK